MNYIWDTIIYAKRKNIDIKKLTFRLADIYSPYLELAMSYINYEIDEESKEIEINPFYRFGCIFNKLFLPDNNELTELREELLNCMLHYISNIDIYMGMNKNEFMRIYIKRDIENGIFGEKLKNNWKYFSIDEQETITNQMINIYQTGSSVEVVRKAVLGVFHDGYVYFNRIKKNELLIFAGERELNGNKEKMEFIMDLFMPVDFEYKIYWSRHFGVIGNDKLMKEDSIVLY